MPLPLRAAALAALALTAPPALAQPEATLLRDLASITGAGNGAGHADPYDNPSAPYLAEYRGEVYFAASDGASGRELWRSNGTPEGTALVADLRPGAESSNPTGFVEYAGVLFVGATTPSGPATFVTDGVRTWKYADGLVPVRPLRNGLLLQGADGSRFVLGSCGLGLSGPLCGYEEFIGPEGTSLVQSDSWLFFTEADSTYRSLGTVPSTSLLVGDQNVQQVRFLASFGDLTLLRCDWRPREDGAAGVELCATTGTPDDVSLVADLVSGTDGSFPALYSLEAGWAYVQYRNGGQTYRFRIDAEQTLQPLDPRISTSGSFQVFPLGGRAYHRARLGDGSYRIWHGADEVLGLGGTGEIGQVASDGRRAFVSGRDAFTAPWTFYAFDGAAAAPVGAAPAEVNAPSVPTVYNGGLLFSNGGSGLYALGVRPRAARARLGGAGRRTGGAVFSVYAEADALPAELAPTAGVADGEVRLGLLSRRDTPLPTDGPEADADAPAPAVLDTYVALDADEALAGLRGTLTLSYREADLDSAGVADEATLGVWQWDAEAGAWAERPVTARDDAANTLTVEDVPVRSLFAIGSETPGAVATAAAPEAALALDVPAPNPTAGRAVIRYRLGAAGPARVTVVDLLGREVAVLADGPHAAGAHAATVEAGRLAPGLYLVRLGAGGATATARLTVAR